MSKIKYPPNQYSKIGRFNKDFESIAYLSSSELATLVELNISYYEVFCSAKIKYIKKDIFFHTVGTLKQNTKSDNNELQKALQKLITTKGSKIYNATNAIASLLLSSKNFKSGILYSSTHEDKTNQNLFNIAVKPKDFDECFQVIGLEYYVLTYDPLQDSIIMESINKGKVSSEGRVTWDLTHPDMMETVNKKIDGDIFKVKHEIIHYLFGGGKIIKDNTDSYLVMFEKNNNTEKILKNQIKNK